MHDKAPLRAALAELAACPVFRSVCDDLRALSLAGVRVPYSGQAVQQPGFHGSSVGIHSLLQRQPGPLSHYLSPRELSFPRGIHAHAVSPDVAAVVAAVVHHWHAGDIDAWRQLLLLSCEQCFSRLDDWNARLRSLMPSSVLEAGGTVPVATVAACVRALDWPHIGLPLCLLGGFDIIGDVPATVGSFPRPFETGRAISTRSITRPITPRLHAGYGPGSAPAVPMRSSR